MASLWKLLDGNKTHIGVIAGGIVGLLMANGVLTAEVGSSLLAIIGVWTGVAIRSAISKSGPTQ